MKNKAKRLSRGHYLYRGYKINCVGYYEPEQRVVWEAVDEYGCGFAQSYTLREVKCEIDYELDHRKKQQEDE